MKKILDPHLQFASFFPQESLQRFASSLIQELDKGSICLDLQGEIPSGSLEDLGSMEDFITQEEEGMKPFVLFNDKLYIRRYFKYESQIIKRIKQFYESGRSHFDQRLEALKASESFKNLERDSELDIDYQLLAAAMGFLQDFCIITGGPGTGKTTTVAKVLNLLWRMEPELKVKLAAPTGKAAMRMSESIKENPNIPSGLKDNFEKLESNTIHRLLGSNFQDPYFKHNAENPLNADLVIIDEASMIDVALFAKLLNAIGPDTRLILLGDKNQLASVEAGSLFGDLCRVVTEQNRFSSAMKGALEEISEYELTEAGNASLLQDHIISLTHSYRFDKEDAIGLISQAVISEDKRMVEKMLDTQAGQLTYDPQYDSRILQEFALKFQYYIKEEDIKEAIRKLNDIRVLAAVRMGKQGIYELNKKIEQYLRSADLLSPSGEFYHNRPILVTKNNPELKLFNGDVGIVRYDKDDMRTDVWFLDETGEPRAVSPGYISEVETCFAMTIHKSQGSEFSDVLIVLPKTEDLELLTKELLYTAITRAKKNVTIQGAKEIILNAVAKSVRRASGVIERLQ